MANDPKGAPFVMQRAQPKAGPGIDPDAPKPETRQVRQRRAEQTALNDAPLQERSLAANNPSLQEVTDSSQAYALVLRDLYERVARLQVAIAAIEALQ